MGWQMGVGNFWFIGMSIHIHDFRLIQCDVFVEQKMSEREREREMHFLIVFILNQN